MNMKRINPNHPVTQALDDDLMHKIAAVLVMKNGGRAEITIDDLEQLQTIFGGEQPTLVTKFNSHNIEFWLVPESEAIELARVEGGLPV